MSGINEDKIAKALANLESMNKSETVTTKVVPMTGQSGPTQVFHTPSNSNPSTWAGSSESDVPGNGPGVDKIASGNGTDLRMMKSILAKLAKGMDLSEDEKKVVAKAMEHDDEEQDKKLISQMVPGAKKDKDDDKKDVKKSLVEIAQESPAVREGFEMSTFLRDQNVALSKSLEGIENRLSRQITEGLEKLRAEYTEVSKSLTGYVGDIGTVVGATKRQVAELETTAARGPKSAAAQNAAMNKSLGGGSGETLSKSMVSSALFDLMVKGQGVSSVECIKFDSTGELTRDLEAKVRAHLSR